MYIIFINLFVCHKAKSTDPNLITIIMISEEQNQNKQRRNLISGYYKLGLQYNTRNNVANLNFYPL